MAIDRTYTVPKSNTSIYSIPIGVGGGGGVLSDATIGPGKFPAHLYDDSVLHHFLKDHAIQGQTVMVEFTTPMEQFDRPLSEKTIKERLVRGLVDEIAKAKCIEFTQMARHDINEMVFRARVHVVPDTQVRIIREIKDARKAT
jgi:hypothetical protein